MLAGLLSVVAFSTKAVDAGTEVSGESAGSHASTSSGVRIIVGGGQRFPNNSASIDGSSLGKRKVNGLFGEVGVGYTLPAHEHIHPGLVFGVDFAKSKETFWWLNNAKALSVKNRGVTPFVNLAALFPVRYGFAPFVQFGWKFQQGRVLSGDGTEIGKMNGAPALGLGLQKQFTPLCAIQGGIDWVFSSGKTFDYSGRKVTAKAGRGLTAHVCAVLTPRGHSFN
jgi:hypothetical protein